MQQRSRGASRMDTSPMNLRIPVWVSVVAELVALVDQLLGSLQGPVIPLCVDYASSLAKVVLEYSYRSEIIRTLKTIKMMSLTASERSNINIGGAGFDDWSLHTWLWDSGPRICAPQFGHRAYPSISLTHMGLEPFPLPVCLRSHWITASAGKEDPRMVIRITIEYESR